GIRPHDMERGCCCATVATADLDGAAPAQDAIRTHQRYWVQDADRGDDGHDSNRDETKVSAGAECRQLRLLVESLGDERAGVVATFRRRRSFEQRCADGGRGENQQTGATRDGGCLFRSI